MLSPFNRINGNRCKIVVKAAVARFLHTSDNLSFGYTSVRFCFHPSNLPCDLLIFQYKVRLKKNSYLNTLTHLISASVFWWSRTPGVPHIKLSFFFLGLLFMNICSHFLSLLEPHVNDEWVLDNYYILGIIIIRARAAQKMMSTIACLR